MSNTPSTAFMKWRRVIYIKLFKKAESIRGELGHDSQNVILCRRCWKLGQTYLVACGDQQTSQ